MRDSQGLLENIVVCAVLLAMPFWGIVHAGESTEPDSLATTEPNSEAGDLIEITGAQQPAPAPPAAERLQPMAPAPAGAQELSATLSPSEDIIRRLLPPDRRASATALGANVALPSAVRPQTDAGSSLRDIPGVAIQRRSPIVSDTRSRGEHTSQLLASGSFWIPARQDLDTMLSKIDAGILRDVIVIKGPYSVRYGPGFSFLDTELLGAPRYENGLESHGLTSLNYQTNGQQWYGRQALWGGSTDWGFRAGYGHRTGSDYESGDDTQIPSSYNSRTFDGAFGLDLSPDSHLEFSYLRLDQTGVEFPGQIFDMDFLVTDGYELKYVLENQCYFDRLTFDTWYNRTRFEGNAQQPGKRRQIPELNFPLNFNGTTDVDAASTGFRLAATWGQAGSAQLTFGTDLRHLHQDLNEVDSFDILTSGPTISTSGNFPIPPSHSVNPGIFLENVLPVTDRLTLRSGARVDWVSTDVEGHPVQRVSTAIDGFPPTESVTDLGDLLGAQHFALWSAFVTADYNLTPCWTASAGVGHAERPPTLTELYARDPFLAILQQGFSFVRGDPELDPERLWQLDLGVKAKYDRFRGGVHGFYAWVQDYVTYEAFGTLGGVPDALAVQFVNTDLATLSGGEVYGEYDATTWLTPFASMSFVEGRDHSRDSRGVPLSDSNGNPIPHGGSRGSSEEPLPGIAPLESRLGLRFHEPTERPRWGVELAARVVDNQDRVANSLLERESGGFTVWDLRGYRQVTNNLLLVGGVENFTDKDYREHLDLRTGAGVFQPGVNFYFGFELSY